MDIARIRLQHNLAYLGLQRFDLSGSALGWGLNLSSNIKLGAQKQNKLMLSVVYGEGVQNYMNDAPVDVGIKQVTTLPPSPTAALDIGEALPLLGLVAFYDHYWNAKWSSSLGYSRLDIENSSGQAASAFKVGQYGLFNLLHYPAKNVMVGGEFQWGNRENNTDGFSVDDYRVQFSFKYNFSITAGGN